MGQREGYKATLEWGFWKYIKYFLVTIIVTWFASWGATRLGNLDLLLWNWLVAVHLANWWLFIIYSVTGPLVGYVFYWNWRKTREQKQRQQAFRDKIGKLELDD